jgi:hypothetical protein
MAAKAMDAVAAEAVDEDDKQEIPVGMLQK